MADALYTAEATSTGGGRDGHVRSADGIIDEDLRVPQSLGGPGGATNPEQLFAAGYSACFHGALRAIARERKVEIDTTTVDAAVSLEKDDDGGFKIAVVLNAHVPGLDQAAADELVHAAHQFCPYSKATRGNIDVQVTATV
jgi:Ohr subfamily peroxiredoxin